MTKNEEIKQLPEHWFRLLTQYDNLVRINSVALITALIHHHETEEHRIILHRTSFQISPFQVQLKKALTLLRKGRNSCFYRVKQCDITGQWPPVSPPRYIDELTAAQVPFFIRKSQIYNQVFIRGQHFFIIRLDFNLRCCFEFIFVAANQYHQQQCEKQYFFHT